MSELVKRTNELLKKANKPTGAFAIARLTAGDVLNLGLTLQPKQEADDLPGHVIVPEINKPAYDDRARNPKVKEFCRHLTELSNRDGATFIPDLGDLSGCSDPV